MGELRKITRKLKRKGLGLLDVKRPEEAAALVLGEWAKERDANLDTWVENYRTGCENADIEGGIKALGKWYEILNGIRAELSRAVRGVYAKAVDRYKAARIAAAKEIYAVPV